jgi:hypothetical protein
MPCNIGINALHGAHHSAQKSTSTGLLKEASITDWSKSAVVASKMYGVCSLMGDLVKALMNAL